MNLLVVLAVAAAFALLRYLKANLLTWAGAWWVGIYIVAALRVHRPDSLVGHRDLHGHRVAGHPRVHVVQPGTPRRDLRVRSSGS